MRHGRQALADVEIAGYTLPRQRSGLIRYSRGKLRILEREALEAASCECYRAIRRQFEQLLMEKKG